MSCFPCVRSDKNSHNQDLAPVHASVVPVPVPMECLVGEDEPSPRMVDFIPKDLCNPDLCTKHASFFEERADFFIGHWNAQKNVANSSDLVQAVKFMNKSLKTYKVHQCTKGIERVAFHLLTLHQILGNETEVVKWKAALKHSSRFELYIQLFIRNAEVLGDYADHQSFPDRLVWRLT